MFFKKENVDYELWIKLKNTSFIIQNQYKNNFEHVKGMGIFFFSFPLFFFFYKNVNHGTAHLRHQAHKISGDHVAHMENMKGEGKCLWQSQ